ncbi:DUF4825 domain-containing protein [Bacillus sp. SJS]|uniref:DUF4825 domain-containing protein n=1 Tax=Bacillus sp. SJS TaxID=1423321 RepID=UPI000691B418|nr:DUF4825 domain-containing protein [Bacillus sp. SJS]KZZ85385.1 hypothetical protein AS29_006310 [Bacillus sp. SJS]
MKKWLAFLFLTGAVTLSAGCQSGESGEAAAQRVLADEKHTFVGDNSAVGGILSQLPGSQYVKTLQLHTKEKPYGLTVTYGLKNGQNDASFENSWDAKNSQKVLLNNAASLLILIENAEWAELKIETEKPMSLKVTKDELQSLFGEDLSMYADDPEKWKKDVADRMAKGDPEITNFLETHLAE